MHRLAWQWSAQAARARNQCLACSSDARQTDRHTMRTAAEHQARSQVQHGGARCMRMGGASHTAAVLPTMCASASVPTPHRRLVGLNRKP